MRKLLRRLYYFIHRREMENELAEEIEFHRAMKQSQFEASGLSCREAASASCRALGNTAVAREDARGIWIWPAAERLWQDISYSARMLLKNPAFTIVAILTLTLGIGANTAMFSVVNGVLLRPLPYSDPDSLALLWTDDVKRNLHEEVTSFITFTEWRGQSRLFSDMALFRSNPLVITGDEAPERTKGSFVSSNLFPLLGVKPLLGRSFSADEEDKMERLVVLGYGLWQRRFGGDQAVIGKTFEIDGDGNSWKQGPRIVQVIGVMPAGFYFPDKGTELWEPAKVYWRWQRESIDRFFNNWGIVGRMKPNVTARQAQNEMTEIGHRLEQAYPAGSPNFPGFTANVVPILEQIMGRKFPLALWIMLGAVGCVLLIACTNVANLFLARGASREQELAIRAALGAGRGRLLRQLLIESMLIALGAGLLSVAIAADGVGWLIAFAPLGLPRLDEILVDTNVFIFAAGISVAAGLLFGLVPAWKMSRSDPNGSLKESSHAASAGVRIRRTRGMLIIAECALAFVLLIGAGLLVRSFLRVLAVDPGFKPENVLLVRVARPIRTAAPNRPPHAVFAARAAKFDEFSRRIAALPGVRSVAVITNLLIPGEAGDVLTVEGRQDSTTQSLTGQLDGSGVSRSFFQTMGVPLRRGRFFTEDDFDRKVRYYANPESGLPPEPIVVNETLARRFFGDESPVGQRLCSGCTGKTYLYEIIGVVGDMHRQGMEKEPIAEYYSLLFGSETADILVRTDSDPLAYASSVRGAIHSIEKNATIMSMSTVESSLGDLGAERRFQTALLTIFAGMALLLAAIGIYGIVRYLVSQRTREIGVRIALGANRSDVVRLVIRQGLLLPFVGLVIGLCGSLAMTRVLEHFLFEVSATDPITFAAVALILMVVTFVACYLPARRAAKVDPIVALRWE